MIPFSYFDAISSCRDQPIAIAYTAVETSSSKTTLGLTVEREVAGSIPGTGPTLRVLK